MAHHGDDRSPVSDRGFYAVMCLAVVVLLVIVGMTFYALYWVVKFLIPAFRFLLMVAVGLYLLFIPFGAFFYALNTLFGLAKGSYQMWTPNTRYTTLQNAVWSNEPWVDSASDWARNAFVISLIMYLISAVVVFLGWVRILDFERDWSWVLGSGFISPSVILVCGVLAYLGQKMR